MRIASGSASSFLKWQKCQAGWAATYAPQNPFVKRTPDTGSDPASMGSAVHEVLDLAYHAGEFNKSGLEQKLIDRLNDLWPAFFPDGHDDMLKAATMMLKKWADAHSVESGYWNDRRIISAEKRQQFAIPTSQGDLPIVFLLDRFDELLDDDGESQGVYEVVDYKTWSKFVPADELHKKIQCRVYALAIWIMYPDAKEVWVNLDQLRYREASRLFTREEAEETFNELIALAEELIATEEPSETLNDECKWCARKMQCLTFRASLDVMGPETITDVDWAIERYLDLKSAQGALFGQLNDLESFFLDFARHEELDEFASEAGDVFVELETKNKVDANMAREVLGDDYGRFVSLYGNPGVTSIKKAMKDEYCFLSDDRKREVASLITEEYGKQKVKVVAR